MKQTPASLDEIASSILDALPARIDPAERVASLCLYRLLARGEPVTIEALADETSLDADDAQTMLGSWQEVQQDEEGRIIGYLGMTLSRTSHILVVEGVQLHAWCAWDALFVPALLGATARIASACPITGRIVRLRVSTDGVDSIDPTAAVVSFVTPTASKVQQDVIHNFCRFVRFLASAEAGAEWLAEHDAGFLLTVDQAFRLGARLNRARYGQSAFRPGVQRAERRP